MLAEARDTALVWDAVEAARAIREFTSGIDKSAYLSDRMRQLAVERAVEIIGEAARLLSQSIKDQHPAIPWRQMIAQRNVLAHDYGAVDPERMWLLAFRDIPVLLVQLEEVLAGLERNS
jgi:uncharacterized protein with HEPN domain